MTNLSPKGTPKAALTALCLALAAATTLAIPAQAATEKVAKTPATAAAAKAQAKPAQPRPAKPYTIEQFMATTSVRGASFSQDERRILFSSNATGIFNVYSQSVDGGEPVALTKSTTESHYAVSYFRTDDRVLFTRDQGGNENNHLIVRELDGSERTLEVRMSY